MRKSIMLMLLSLLLLIATPIWASDDHYGEDHHDGYRSKFYGTVTQLPAKGHGTWLINGRKVLVTPKTRIDEKYGRASVGSYVEIKGSNDGETFHAYELEVKRGHHKRSDDDHDRYDRDDHDSDHYERNHHDSDRSYHRSDS